MQPLLCVSALAEGTSNVTEVIAGALTHADTVADDLLLV